MAELVVLLTILVPVMGSGDSLDPGGKQVISTPLWSGTVNRPMLFALVSLASGALGGALHGVASLTAHVAADDFGERWTMWYITSPFVGAALASVFLFVLQAGLGGQATSSTQGGLYGIAAVAALSGLFSRHALAKLKDIFDVTFAGRPAPSDGNGPQARAATVTGASGAPMLLGLSPSIVPAAVSDTRLTVSGSGFATDSVIDVAGTRLSGTVTADSISLVVPAGLLSQAGTLPVRVRSRGLWSVAAELEVAP